MFTDVDERDTALVRLRLLIEQLENALRARDRHRDGVELLGNLRDVAGELLAHAEIRRDDRDRQRRDERACPHKILHGEIGDDSAGGDEHTAGKRGQDIEKISDVVHDRAKDVRKAVRVFRVMEQLLIQRVKVALGGLLVAEDLDDLLAVHHSSMKPSALPSERCWRTKNVADLPPTRLVALVMAQMPSTTTSISGTLK